MTRQMGRGLDASLRTCRSLASHGAKHLVLIDSISPRRAPTAGRALEAEQMDAAEWAAFADRFAAWRSWAWITG